VPYPDASAQAQTHLELKTNPEGRWRKHAHVELMAPDNTTLVRFWLKEDLDTLPE